MDNRGIDERTAREFLGWHESKTGLSWCDDDGNIKFSIIAFHPTNDPVSNGLVLDEIERHGWKWRWESRFDDRGISVYRFEIEVPDDSGFFILADSRSLYTWYENRYHAVCEAALGFNIIGEKLWNGIG